MKTEWIKKRDVISTNGILQKILIKTSQSKIPVKLGIVEITVNIWGKGFKI